MLYTLYVSMWVCSCCKRPGKQVFSPGFPALYGQPKRALHVGEGTPLFLLYVPTKLKRTDGTPLPRLLPPFPSSACGQHRRKNTSNVTPACLRSNGPATQLLHTTCFFSMFIFVPIRYCAGGRCRTSRTRRNGGLRATRRRISTGGTGPRCCEYKYIGTVIDKDRAHPTTPACPAQTKSRAPRKAVD